MWLSRLLSTPPSPGVTSQLCHSNLSRPNSALARGGIRDPVPRCVAFPKLSLFNTWLQILAVNYSLKSGTHRHHQTLCFIPGDALPGLYCNSLQFLLVLGAFPLRFCLQQVKCMLNWIQVRWLTWPLHNIPLLCLKKLFGCFRSMLRVIVHLHCEAPSNEFWSIWLNMSR